MKQPFSLFGCCGVSEVVNCNFYYYQNGKNSEDFVDNLIIKTEENEEEENEVVKKDVEYIKSCFYDENRGSGVTLGDLFDFSKFNFEF